MATELTSRMLAQSRVIAKGNRIRDVQRLVADYGGTPSQWVKKVVHSLQSAGLLMSTIGMSTQELDAWK